MVNKIIMKKLHHRAIWLFLFSKNNIIWIFLGLLAIIIGSIVVFMNINNPRYIIEILDFNSMYFLFLLVFIILLLSAYVFARLTYYFYRYSLDQNEIKIEKGIIWRKNISIPYKNIQNVDIYRGIMCRLLGLSDLQIQTSGYGAVGKEQSGSEGRLPGILKLEAEKLQIEIMQKVKQ